MAFVYASYTITFVEQPSFDSLDTCEGEWRNKLNAQVYIQKHGPPSCKIILDPFLSTYEVH